MAAIMISVAGINCETYLAINEESIYGERRIKSHVISPSFQPSPSRAKEQGTCVDT